MSNLKETSNISDIIIKRKNKVAIKRDYIQLFTRLIFVVVAGYLIFTQVFLITRIEGNGMFPAIKDGDLAIVFRLQQDYLKNDVISYKVDDIRHMGRIMARGGDVITLDDSGTLLINGTPQSGEILFPTYANEETQYPYKVPEDTFYVLGDYRTQTEDSRDFGPIPIEEVEGKVITILRRRGL